MNFTTQGSYQFHGHSVVGSFRQQIAFWSQRRTGHQQHFIAVEAHQVLTTQQRVLLRPADNHPRNDMNNTHQKDFAVLLHPKAMQGRPWLKTVSLIM
jgi:hypothetical protein